MKIYINKPRNHYFSPYTLLEAAFFWREIDYDEPKIERLHNLLKPFSTGLQKVLDFIHPNINYIKIDGWDIWNMDNTLSPIILKMLLVLKEDKSGRPHVYNEDLPIELRTPEVEKHENLYEDLGPKWDYILNEMIFAFTSDTIDWEKNFCSGNFDMEFKKQEGTNYSTLEIGPLHTYKRDEEGVKAYQARIDEGRRLFAKYYNSLWT